MQKELLDRYPDANLRVYAVWFNMMPADTRSKWSPNLLTDSRAIHRWDEPKTVGRWFGRHTTAIRPRLTSDSSWNGGEILWDAYLLYGADAAWNNEPDGLIHFGRTIVAARESLRADFERLFAK